MKFTAHTARVLAARRMRKRLIADGYEEVGEGGGKLWELHRGYRYGHIITDVKVGPDGKSVFIKTALTPPSPSP